MFCYASMEKLEFYSCTHVSSWFLRKQKHFSHFDEEKKKVPSTQ